MVETKDEMFTLGGVKHQRGRVGRLSEIQRVRLGIVRPGAPCFSADLTVVTERVLQEYTHSFELCTHVSLSDRPRVSPVLRVVYNPLWYSFGVRESEGCPVQSHS